jgi:hypothetical protein
MQIYSYNRIMKKEAIIKRIDCTRDYFNRLWNSLIATIAGTIAVLISPDTGFKWFLLPAGIILAILCIHFCLVNDRLLKKFIKELEKEK